MLRLWNTKNSDGGYQEWLEERTWSKLSWRRVVVILLVVSIGAGVSYYFWPESSTAASVGPRFATATGDCVNDTSAAGTVSWTNPGNAFSDNATNATVAVDGTSSEYIKCTNFGFTSSMVPSGSVIDGIVVTVERFANSAANASQDAAVRIVKGGTIGATDRSTSTLFTISAVAENHGGSTDTWGESWSATDVTSSDFGVAYSATKPSATGPAVTVSVDYISITVYFTAPVWTTITQRQGVITNDQNNTVLSSHSAKIGERMRVVTQVDTNPGAVKNRVFKLQYDKNSSGSWADVAPANEIRPARSSIRGIGSPVGTGIAGTCTGGVLAGKGFMFEDVGRTTSISITGGGCHDIGFVVDTKNATANTTYRFRLYDVTGAAALNTYSAYASFTTVSSANDTIRSSKSSTTSLAGAQSDLKTLLDNQGYSNTNSDNAAREILQNVSSDTTADATITGGTSNFLGWSVSPAGDTNGDGYDDIVVGVPKGSGTAGQVHIFFGGALFDTTVDVTITGETTAGSYGRSVASAGDVNGDGYGDVIIGDFFYSSSTGRAYIYYGGSSMDNTADVTITGDASINFGVSVASAGDVNGDGYADVIVGATGYTSNTGRAYIYYGSSSISSSMTTSSANVTMTGAGGNDYFGNSVSSAGDVNGDGYGDVIVGSYEFNAGAGLVYIFYGGSSMNNSADVTMTGQVSVDSFGFSVSNAGDVNGDGYDDVIVGANRYDNGGGSSDNWGRAYIFYGSSSMSSSIAAASANVIMTGSAIGSEFGGAVASAGDVNGDGYGDVIVGADAYSSSTGEAYVYYGGSSMNGTADMTVTGEATSDRYGTSVAAAGDVNGDGYGDLLVGARQHGGVNNNGRAYIYYQSYQANSTADKTMTGGATSNSFGYSVSSTGDVNGDGYDDVVVGAWGYSTSTGRAYVFYGGPSMDTTADVTMTGEATSNSFGWSVGSGGDVNGDGYDDVVVGAPQNSLATGRAYVFFGGASMDTTADVTMSGVTASEEFGSLVSLSGDVNGDGYADVVVGAVAYNASNYTGRAYVFYGGASMNITVDVTMTGEAAGNNFGTSVSSSGDVNGDGYADVVVGATGYDVGSGTNEGRAYVFYGSSSMSSSIAASSANVIMTGETTSNNFGSSVSLFGDVNGDGYDDVVVGANNYSTSTGRAYVFYGSSSMSSSIAASSANVIMTGETTSNEFGKSVFIGDVNGDRYDDVVVGASGYSSSTGRAYIFYGGVSMDTTADVTMTGEASSNNFGFSVSTSGDVNGDGYDDVVVGASGHSTSTGRAYFYLGGSSSYIPTFNLAQKHTSTCSGLTSIDGSWNGQSNVAASTNNLLLQIYRFGSTNAWETVDTESSLAANTDGTLNGSKTSSLSEYCDGSNWSYWRLYQASGTQSLQTDDFDIAFTSGGGPTPTPTPAMDQKMKGGNWWNEGVRQFLRLQ